MISKVYPYSSEIAQQIGEKSQYSVSRVENIKCAMDIKDAIDAC